MSQSLSDSRPPYVLGARRRRRVHFEAAVRLREPAARRSLAARTSNLSESGILVTAREVPDPGSDIECAFLVGDEERILPGRVVWSRPGAARGARAVAGIEFRDLAGDDQRLLTKLVDGIAREQTVLARLDAADFALEATTAVMTEELHVRVPLPALAPGSPLEVSFEHRGVAERRAGTVEELVLHVPDDGGRPALLVKVSTPRPAAARGTIEARPLPEAPAAAGDEPSVLLDVSALSGRGAPRAAEAEVIPFRRRANRYLPPAVQRARRAVVEQGRWRGLLVGGSLLASLAIGAFTLGRGRGRSAPPPVELPPKEGTSPPNRPEFEPLPPRPARGPARPLPARSAPGARAGGGVAGPFSVSSRLGQTIVRLPLATTPKTFTQYPREIPVVDVIVNLPDGEPVAADGSYRIGRGSARAVRVLRRGAGTQVRFALAAPGLDYRVTVEPGALVLTIYEPTGR